MLNIVLNVLKGMAVGVANVIPGVSGGTIAVILGIYEKLTNGIGNLFKEKDKIKENSFFLVQIGIGMVLGILFFAKLIGYLYSYHNKPTNFFFLGLILSSIPFIIKSGKDMKFNYKKGLFFIIGLIITLVFVFIKVDSSKNDFLIKKNNQKIRDRVAVLYELEEDRLEIAKEIRGIKDKEKLEKESKEIEDINKKMENVFSSFIKINNKNILLNNKNLEIFKEKISHNKLEKKEIINSTELIMITNVLQKQQIILIRQLSSDALRNKGKMKEIEDQINKNNLIIEKNREILEKNLILSREKDDNKGSETEKNKRTNSKEFKLFSFYSLKLLFCGVIAAGAMIIPGISGSFLLILLGEYYNILEFVNKREFTPIIIIMVGAMIGLMYLSKLIAFLLKKYNSETLYFIIGLIVGSIFEIYPGDWIHILVLVLGFCIAFYTGKIKKA